MNGKELVENKSRGIGVFYLCILLTFKRIKRVYFKNKLRILRQTQAF